MFVITTPLDRVVSQSTCDIFENNLQILMVKFFEKMLIHYAINILGDEFEEKYILPLTLIGYYEFLNLLLEMEQKCD
jgi:hypothetical protein